MAVQNRVFFAFLSLFFTASAFAQDVIVHQRVPAGDCAWLCKRLPEEKELHKVLNHSSKDALPDRTLNLLVWNIYKGRKEKFLPTFARLSKGADVVMLSESTDGELVKPALDKLTGWGFDMGVTFFMKDDVRTGLITGSYALPTAVAVEQTADIEPWVKSPKALLISKYAIEDERGRRTELMLINIHGINWRDGEAFKRHLLLAEPYIKSHQGPILFAGDFNQKVRRYDTLSEFAKKFGFRRVNWSNGKPSDEKQLDDAIVRGMDVVSAKFDYDVVDNEGSDHPAMLLQLKLNNFGRYHRNNRF
jgi:endonuclease/exonuclease/phosphatase (EEP) superfamily protein YafD